MSKRLQVLVDDAEYRRLQQAARRQGQPMSEWVRQALRAAASRLPSGGADRKIAVVRAAVKNEFPAGDIDEMLAEIERGYRGGSGA